MSCYYISLQLHIWYAKKNFTNIVHTSQSLYFTFCCCSSHSICIPYYVDNSFHLTFGILIELYDNLLWLVGMQEMWECVD